MAGVGYASCFNPERSLPHRGSWRLGCVAWCKLIGFALCLESGQRGAIAKRLCNGLQIRVARFDSGSRLQNPASPATRVDGAVLLDAGWHGLQARVDSAARVVKSVDTRDLKSLAARRAGSSPAPGTMVFFCLFSSAFRGVLCKQAQCVQPTASALVAADGWQMSKLR